jgi:hypothetical protein
LWTLVSMLLDANPVHQCAMPPSESQIMEELAAQTKGDLGEIGGEGEAGSSNEDKEDMEANTNEVKGKKPIKINIEDLNDFHLWSSSGKVPRQKLSPLLVNYAWHIHNILLQ